MLLQKIVMERSDWKKRKKRKISRDHAHPVDEKKVDGCRYKFDTYETQLHFWRVLSIIGDRPAIIAYRGFPSTAWAKGKVLDEARFYRPKAMCTSDS